MPRAGRCSQAAPARMEARLEGSAGGRREQGGTLGPLRCRGGGWLGQRAHAVEGGVAGCQGRGRRARVAKEAGGAASAGRGRAGTVRFLPSTRKNDATAGGRLKLSTEELVPEGEFRCPPKFGDPGRGCSKSLACWSRCKCVWELQVSFGVLLF